MGCEEQKYIAIRGVGSQDLSLMKKARARSLIEFGRFILTVRASHLIFRVQTNSIQVREPKHIKHTLLIGYIKFELSLFESSHVVYNNLSDYS